MQKKICTILFTLFCIFVFPLCAKADDGGDNDEWTKYLDVYTSDGLDRPVNAIEYKKTMDKLEELKNKKNKKKKRWKKDEYPEPLTKNEPIKKEKEDIIKVLTPLYYDGKTVPVGFYKIVCTEENSNYYISLVQGKTSIIKIKANKVSHMDFCPDKVNCVKTEEYQKKYFKISFKTIDYAVVGYLTKVNY